MSGASRAPVTHGRHGGRTDHSIWIVAATALGEIALFSALGLAAMSLVARDAGISPIAVAGAGAVIVCALMFFARFMAYSSPHRLPLPIRGVVVILLGAAAAITHAMVGIRWWAWIAGVAAFLLVACLWWISRHPITDHRGRHTR